MLSYRYNKGRFVSERQVKLNKQVQCLVTTKQLSMEIHHNMLNWMLVVIYSIPQSRRWQQSQIQCFRQCLVAEWKFSPIPRVIFYNSIVFPFENVAIFTVKLNSNRMLFCLFRMDFDWSIWHTFRYHHELFARWKRSIARDTERCGWIAGRSKILLHNRVGGFVRTCIDEKGTRANLSCAIDHITERGAMFN